MLGIAESVILVGRLARRLQVNPSNRGCIPTRVLLAPRMGAYNLTSVRPYVRPSVDSDFSEVYGSTGLKL